MAILASSNLKFNGPQDWVDSVLSYTNTPPGSPNNGDRYLIGTSPTGDWIGHENEIAEWRGEWVYTTPTEGCTLWIEDENKYYVFDGNNWITVSSTLDHGELQGLSDDDHTQYIRVDGTRAFTGDQSLGNHNLTNVADPINPQDAATKNYVDTQLDGQDEFIELDDTPNSYSGEGGKSIRVKATEDGLEFYTPSDQDEHVKVSSNDTTAGYLNGKLTAGTGINLTENNDGGDKTLEISSTITQYTDEDAQDAVGSILTDTNTIDFTYDDSGNQITADVRYQNTSTVQLSEDANGLKADVVQSAIDHGNLSGLSDDDHTQYLLVNGSRAMSGDLDLGTNDITNVNLVDGVDVSNHHARHENGGADEINVTGLSGELADPQTPKTHASTHESGGSDEINVGGLSGVLSDDQHAGWLRDSVLDDPISPSSDWQLLRWDSANSKWVVDTIVLDDISDVDAASPSDGDALVYNSGTGKWEPGSASGASVFTALTDTPSSYTGEGDKVLKVNNGETGVEFSDVLQIDDTNNKIKILGDVSGERIELERAETYGRCRDIAMIAPSGSGNYAVYFNPSSSQYADVSFDYGSYDDVSVDFWIYIHSYPSGYTTLFSSGPTLTVPRLYIRLSSSGTIAVYRGTYTPETASSIPLNAWTHVVVTCQGGSVNVYFNGALDDNSPMSCNLSTNPQTHFYFAHGYHGYGDIELDEVVFYDTVLTAAEVSDSYNSGLGTCHAAGGNIQGLYHLDEGTGTTATDSSGNGRDATLVNAPSWTTGHVDCGSPVETPVTIWKRSDVNGSLSIGDGANGITLETDTSIEGNASISGGADVSGGDLDLHQNTLKNANRAQIGPGGWYEAYLHVNVNDVPGGVATYSTACLEDNSRDVTLYLLTHSSHMGKILFGDESNKYVGQIVYDHTVNEMKTVVNYTWGPKINSSCQLDMNNRRILNVSDPTSTQDAATKNYVDQVKEIFYPCQGTGSRGNYAGVMLLGDGGIGRVSGHFPSNMTSISNIVLVVIPVNSHTSSSVVIDVQYASSGESYNTNTGGMTFTGALTADQITEIDISGLFGSATGGDYFGVQVTDNNTPLSHTDDLFVLGIRLKWV